MDKSLQDFRTLRSALARVRRAWRLNAAAQGLMVCAAAMVLPVAAGLFAGAGGYVRPALLALAAALGAVLFLWRVAWPLARPLGWTDVSRFIERRNPALEERLTSAVELRPALGAAQPRYGAAMLGALLADAAASARAVPLPRVLNLRATRTAALVFCATAAVVAGGFAARPRALAKLPAFVAPPYLPRQVVYGIAWVSGDATIAVHGAVTLSARLSGAVDGPPDVVLMREGLAPQRRAMDQDAPREFSLRLPSVDGDTTYFVQYRDKKSATYRIITVEPPSVRFIKTRLTYPGHTGIPPESRENAGDIAAPFGTRAALEISSSTPIKQAYLMMNGEKQLLHLSAPDTATGSFKVVQDATYTVHLIDAHGFANRLAPEYSVRSLPDADPEISLEKPEADMELPRAVSVLIKGAARDDYGIAAVTLHYSVEETGTRGAVRVPITPGPDTAWEMPWDLTRVQAFPGDTIEYFLSASDNDALTGPKSARTPARRITIMSPFEEYKDVEREAGQVLSQLSAATSEAAAVADTFKSLSQNLSEKKAAEWKKSADVERALDRQKALENELTEISDRMANTAERMQSNEFVSLDTLDKMQQIQSIMDNILTEDMKKLIDKIQKNMEDVDISSMDRELLESLKDQEQLLRNLENTLQRLKRIQAEQKLHALTEHLQQLADRQQQVVDQSKDLKKKKDKSGLQGADKRRLDQLAREEQRIREEIQEELSRMESLKKDLANQDPDAADRLDKMQEQSRDKQLDKNLDSASDALRGERMPPALEFEQKALQAMLTLASGAQQLQSDFSAAMNEATRARLVRTLRKTLNVSQSQEETLGETERLIQRPGRGLTAAEETRLVKDARFQRDVLQELGADLAVLANSTLLISPALSADAADAASRLNRALEDIKQNRPVPDIHASLNAAYTTVNHIMLALLEAKSGGQAQGGQGAMEQFMDQLQKLADSQQSLNMKTQQLMQGGIPMPQLNSGLQALAAQQKMIRQGMKDLMESSENMGELGARMQQIEKDMEEIEKQLFDAKADPGVQRRQSDVLRRLKDATLSLRKEVFEDQRKAETGREYAPQAPKPLDTQTGPQLPQEIRREIDRLKKEKRLPGYENAIDTYYRELLSPK